MELQFTGEITEIRPVRTGTTQKGEWANVEFEVTESKDQYPQVGLFDFFKNGEYLKYAKEFDQFHKVGDMVTVYFNLKKNTYTKQDGSQASFYKTSAWKIEKVGNDGGKPQPTDYAPAVNLQEDEDDLPF